MTCAAGDRFRRSGGLRHRRRSLHGGDDALRLRREARRPAADTGLPTDIDEAAIAAERDGYYTINDAADVPPERLSRYFMSEGGEGYRVRRETRERVNRDETKSILVQIRRAA